MNARVIFNLIKKSVITLVLSGCFVAAFSRKWHYSFYFHFFLGGFANLELPADWNYLGASYGNDFWRKILAFACADQ